MNKSGFRWGGGGGGGGLVPIVDTKVFEQTYYHLLHCLPDVRSLVEPVARIEESVVCSTKSSHGKCIIPFKGSYYE